VWLETRDRVILILKREFSLVLSSVHKDTLNELMLANWIQQTKSNLSLAAQHAHNIKKRPFNVVKKLPRSFVSLFLSSTASNRCCWWWCGIVCMGNNSPLTSPPLITRFSFFLFHRIHSYWLEGMSLIAVTMRQAGSLMLCFLSNFVMQRLSTRI